MAGTSCPNCSAALAPGARFCDACGGQLTALAPAPESPFSILDQDPTGLLALAVVAIVGIVVSFLLWSPAKLPAKLIDAPIPDMNCTGETPGTNEMRICAAKVAVVKMIGPMVLAGLVVLFRKPIGKQAQVWARKVPAGAGQLLAPLVATAFFLIIWAGIHRSTGGQTGIVSQKMFPAIIGVYTFAVVRYSPAVQRKMAGYFDARERVPVWVRAVITLAVPTLVSYVITNQERVSDTALKEQFVVLLGLALAYFALAPRGSDIVGGLQRMIPGRAQPQPGQPR